MSRITPLDTSSFGRQAADIDITVSSNLASCRHLWIALQDQAVTTAFQSYEWLEAWQRHVGKNSGVQPIIVSGRRLDGRTAFILPFGLLRKRGSAILTWLSAPHSNYGCAIFDRRFLEREEPDFTEIWRRVVALLPKLDAVVLSNQPTQLDEFENPFVRLRTSSSADRSHVLDLNKPFDDLLRAKFSSRSRRRLAQHQRKLEEQGSWQMAEAIADTDISRVIDAMFAQKREQLARRGIADPFTPAFKGFFRSYALDGRGTSRALKCYYLECGGDIVATNFGAVHRGTYYGLVTTMAEGRVDKFSPGSLTMNFAIACSCGEDLTAFDFSAGEADYKSRWADRTVELFETHIPLTLRGRVHCHVERARIWLKRRIKHSPTLWRWARSVRAVRGMRSGSAAVF